MGAGDHATCREPHDQDVRRMVPELRLAASTNIDNVRSNRLIRRLGFHPSGRSDVWSTPLQRVVRTICYEYKP